MSEYEVSFTETFIIKANSREEAISIAKDNRYASYDMCVSSVACQIIPKLLKERV